MKMEFIFKREEILLQFRPLNGFFKRLAMNFERDKLLFAIDQIMSYRPLVKNAYQKINFLISQPNICCGYSKELSQ